MDNQNNLGYPVLDQPNNPNFQNAYPQFNQQGNTGYAPINQNPEFQTNQNGQYFQQGNGQYVPPNQLTNQGYPSAQFSAQYYGNNQGQNPYPGTNQNIPYVQPGMPVDPYSGENSGDLIALRAELDLIESRLQRASDGFRSICTVLICLSLFIFCCNLIFFAGLDPGQLLGFIIICIITRPGFEDKNAVRPESIRCGVITAKVLIILNIISTAFICAAAERGAKARGVSVGSFIMLYIANTFINVCLFSIYIQRGNELAMVKAKKQDIIRVLGAIALSA